jgi:hypothetical protein
VPASAGRRWWARPCWAALPWRPCWPAPPCPLPRSCRQLPRSCQEGATDAHQCAGESLEQLDSWAVVAVARLGCSRTGHWEPRTRSNHACLAAATCKPQQHQLSPSARLRRQHATAPQRIQQAQASSCDKKAGRSGPSGSLSSQTNMTPPSRAASMELGGCS